MAYTIASIMGPILLLMGLGSLLNQKGAHKLIEQVLKDEPLYYTLGVIDLLLGLIVVLNHNAWEWSWMVLITLIGWFMTLKGAFTLVLFGQTLERSRKAMSKQGTLSMHVANTIIGAALTYFAFLS